jgi:sulfoxide reductase heme-binding subunit YedZ
MSASEASELIAADDSATSRHRRWPPEKVVALAVAVAPALWLAGLDASGELGVRAVHQAVRISGDWAVRMLWLALLVSPARRILGAPRLVRARRILGVGAFGLTVLHFGLYALDQQFDWGRIGSEIVLRVYLAVGTVAMVALAALAATSNDQAIRRLGSARWNWLHGSVYAIAALVVVHFLLRSRTATFEPMLMLGLLAWLVGYRLIHRFAGNVSARGLVALAVAAAALTAVAETSWHAAATGVDPWRLLAAHLDASYEVRPAWWVLLAGLAAALAAARWRMLPSAPRRPQVSVCGNAPLPDPLHSPSKTGVNALTASGERGQKGRATSHYASIARII